MTESNNAIDLLTIQERAGGIDKISPALVYLASLTAARSRYVQRGALDKIAAISSGDRITACKDFPWHLLRYEHTTAIRTRLIEIYAPATVRRFLAALKGVLRSAWLTGLMTAEEYQRAAALPGVVGSTVPAGRELSSGEIDAILTACQKDNSPEGVRDAAIIGVSYGCGLRRAEVAALNLSDYDREAGSLKVHGKRNKERLVYLPEGAKSLLADWLTIRGESDGALFRRLVISGRRANSDRDNMTCQSVYAILQKRAGEAGVKDVSPHDLRRTYVSNLLDKGNDLVTVSKMVGHDNVQTTARYDRRPEDAKRRAAGTLHVPYKSRIKQLSLEI